MVYAPIENGENEEKDTFSADLEEVMRNTVGLAMVEGDFKARIGSNRKEWLVLTA